MSVELQAGALPSAGASPAPEADAPVSADGTRNLPFTFARRHGIVMRAVEDGVALCAVRADANPAAIAEARRALRLPIRLARVSDEEFEQLLRQVYESGAGTLAMAGGELTDNADLEHLAQELPEQADLLESNDEAPIIRLINALLSQAIRDNASDIHIETFESRLVVRLRVDGVLREVLQTRRLVAPLVVSRIKVMSRLDIAEKRLPQDGRRCAARCGRPVAGASRRCPAATSP